MGGLRGRFGGFIWGFGDQSDRLDRCIGAGGALRPLCAAWPSGPFSSPPRGSSSRREPRGGEPSDSSAAYSFDEGFGCGGCGSVGDGNGGVVRGGVVDDDWQVRCRRCRSTGGVACAGADEASLDLTTGVTVRGVGIPGGDRSRGGGRWCRRRVDSYLLREHRCGGLRPGVGVTVGPRRDIIGAERVAGGGVVAHGHDVRRELVRLFVNGRRWSSAADGRDRAVSGPLWIGREHRTGSSSRVGSMRCGCIGRR